MKLNNNYKLPNKTKLTQRAAECINYIYYAYFIDICFSNIETKRQKNCVRKVRDTKKNVTHTQYQRGQGESMSSNVYILLCGVNCLQHSIANFEHFKDSPFPLSK